MEGNPSLHAVPLMDAGCHSDSDCFVTPKQHQTAPLASIRSGIWSKTTVVTDCALVWSYRPQARMPRWLQLACCSSTSPTRVALMLLSVTLWSLHWWQTLHCLSVQASQQTGSSCRCVVQCHAGHLSQLDKRTCMSICDGCVVGFVTS